MNVTFLTSHFPELSEQFIINQVVGLIDDGVDISIISLHDSKKNMINPEFDLYNITDRIEFVSIPKKLLYRAFKAVPKIFKLLILSPGKLFTAFNIRRYRRAVFSLKTVYILDFYMKKEKINVLHCHFGPNGIVGSFMKDVGIVNKLISTFHGSDINSYPLRYGKNIYAHLFNVIDCITVNTSFTGNRVAAYGADWKKISIVPVGLKCVDYPDLKTGFDFSGSPVILTVARMEEKKGHRYALYALYDILEKYPDTKYHIAGSGSLREELYRLAIKLHLDRNVVFHGYCNRNKIFELYRLSSVFLLPSVTAANGDMEGQGLVLQEAQAVGLPVISTLHNGIPDGVIDGRTGFLVPEKDSSAIAEKVFYLVEHPREAARMGMAGRKFVQGKYDIPILTGKIMDIYKKV